MLKIRLDVFTGTLIGNGLLGLYDWTYPSIPGRELGIGSSFFPTIATVGEVSYLAWRELNVFSRNVCLFKYNRGTGWSLPPDLSAAAIGPFMAENDIPTAVISDSATAFFGFGIDFDSQNFSTHDVYVISHRGTDTLAYQIGANISNSPERDLAANFTISFDNELVTAWERVRNGKGRIYFSKTHLVNYDRRWSKPIPVSDDSTSAHNPQIVAISPDTLLFVWLQGELAPFEIIARRFPPLITTVDAKREGGSVSTSPIHAAIHPNPLQFATNFEINITMPGLLSIKIYNMQGQLIKSFIERRALPGTFRYSWDITDDRGSSVTNGVYIAILQFANTRIAKKIVVVK